MAEKERWEKIETDRYMEKKEKRRIRGRQRSAPAPEPAPSRRRRHFRPPLGPRRFATSLLSLSFALCTLAVVYGHSPVKLWCFWFCWNDERVPEVATPHCREGLELFSRYTERSDWTRPLSPESPRQHPTTLSLPSPFFNPRQINIIHTYSFVAEHPSPATAT